MEDFAAGDHQHAVVLVKGYQVLEVTGIQVLLEQPVHVFRVLCRHHFPSGFSMLREV
jgi:hypothetical protein